MAAAALLSTACARRQPPYEVPAADPATKRETTSGAVIGGEGRYGSNAWLGIPFAKPPVGDLRWRPPEPPDAWQGVRPALTSGPACVQYTSPFGGVEGPADTPTGDEDCLTLNLWTPRFADGKVPTGEARLPVMVWIHGGGNTIGQKAFYEGGKLAVDENLVVVAVQYRLGPFGWFRHAALRDDAESDDDASGNFGTLDLILSLEWVRDNVAAFGGNPHNITIFGESAGAQNVYSLLLAPAARGLFQRAIAESGGLEVNTPAEAENFTDDPEPGEAQSSNEILARLALKDGRAKDRAQARDVIARTSPAEIRRDLRKRSAFEILAAYTPMPGAGMITHPRLFADGAVLPAGDPVASLAEREAQFPLPLMVGTNHDENKLFMFGNPRWITWRLWLFPRFVDESLYLATAEHLAQMWKVSGADEPARAIRAADGAGVFVYRFDWNEEPTLAGSDFSKMLGAAHGFEIPFVFGHFDLGSNARALFTKENEPGREELSRAMMSYWAEFARFGTPSRGAHDNLPEWTAWGADPDSKTLVLDTTAGGGIRMTPIEETTEAVLRAVDDDPRLATQKDRCRVFHDLAQWSRGFGKADYATAGKSGCADYPFQSYPWTD